MKSRERSREKRIVVFSLVGSMLLTACDTDPGREIRLFMANVTYVSVEGYRGEYEKDADVLNNWLRNNPQKQVVTFTGILAYRSENSGYEIVTKPGPNKRQLFEFLETQDGDLDNEARVIQKWLDSNPNRDMLAIASIPRYSGGAEGYIVLSVPEEQ